MAEAERRFREQEGERATFEQEKARCAADPIHWINTWVWTYDPRLVGSIDPATGRKRDGYIPLKLFPKQEALIRWTFERIRNQEQGALDKSRDVGATYVLGAISLHQWLFAPGFKATFGSREADLVDKLDDPDTIFQKIRLMLARLPIWQLPKGFEWYRHSNLMRLINPETSATITGEAGDDMGRGGRSTLFVVDEAAFVRRAAVAERAIVGNADCVIWASSSNGLGTQFYRKKMGLPPKQVFRFHYSDDPRKTPDWVRDKRASMDPVAWASEYEIDDTASVEGVCIPAAWVQSAQRLLALQPDLPRANRGVSGGDVGGGKAKSVVVHRFGPIVLSPERRNEADTTDTALWMLESCFNARSTCLNFDTVGIGAGVQSTLSKADQSSSKDVKKWADHVQRVPVNTGIAPTSRTWPDERTSEEMFGNLKAELWWLARQALQRTHAHVLYLLKQEGGEKQRLDELIALPSDDASLAMQLSTVKVSRNDKGKIVIETKQALAKRGVASPDDADAFVLTFLEPPDDDTSGIRLDVNALHRGNWAKIV